MLSMFLIILQDKNCICHALQFDTIQAMLWRVIQYDLVLLLCLLWPWPLTYIGIYLFAYRARYATVIVCNHFLKYDITKSLSYRNLYWHDYSKANIGKMTFDLFSKWPWLWICIFLCLDKLQMSCSLIWYHAWHVYKYFSRLPYFSTLTYFDLDLWPS